jgi:hypothetical protein
MTLALAGGSAPALLLALCTLAALLQRAAAQTPALVSLTSSSPDGVYLVGSSVSLSLTFNVAVVLAACPQGAPTLMLNVASAPHSAVYTSGNGTAALVFTYSPQPGDVTPVGRVLDVAGARGVPTFTTGDLNGPYGTSPLIFPLNSNCRLLNAGTQTVAATPASLVLPNTGLLNVTKSITVADPRLNLTLTSSFVTQSGFVTQSPWQSGYRLTLTFRAAHDPHFSFSDAHRLTIATTSLFTGQNAEWALWLEPGSFATTAGLAGVCV